MTSAARGDATVSVVIAAHDRAHYLREAISSVLAQTHGAVEVVIVDDGSTDDTAAVARSFGTRVLYRHQENRGVGAARNAGVAVATGAHLAFLDDDDVWLPDKLERQMAALAADPSLDGVYGHAEQFVSPELDDADRARLAPRDGWVVPAPLPSALLIRRASFDRVGPFDETLRVGIEIDWFGRLTDVGLRTEVLGTVVYRRRLHASNLNRAGRGDQRERLEVLKRTLDRRRRTQ